MVQVTVHTCCVLVRESSHSLKDCIAISVISIHCASYIITVRLCPQHAQRTSPSHVALRKLGRNARRAPAKLSACFLQPPCVRYPVGAVFLCSALASIPRYRTNSFDAADTQTRYLKPHLKCLPLLSAAATAPFVLF